MQKKCKRLVTCTNTCCKKVVNVGTECIVTEGALTVPFNTNKAVAQKFYYCLYALCITNRPPWTNIWLLLELTFNPLNAKFTKCANTLNQFVGKLPTNCLSVFGHFVGLAFIGCSSSTYCYFECVCNFLLRFRGLRFEISQKNKSGFTFSFIIFTGRNY